LRQRSNTRPNGPAACQSPVQRLYDRLPEIDQGVIVESKRLGQVLEIGSVAQASARALSPAPLRAFDIFP